MMRLALKASALFLLLSGCTSIPGVPTPPSATAPTDQTTISRACAGLARHQYEVCFAYVVNDTWLARVPLYTSGREPDLRQAVLTRFDSRYYDPARSQLLAQQQSWPAQVRVSVPHISIVGPVEVNSAVTTATIHTVETWLVRTYTASGQPGRTLFAEDNVHHTVVLHRTPTILCVLDHCLHKWVVVNIS